MTVRKEKAGELFFVVSDTMARTATAVLSLWGKLAEVRTKPTEDGEAKRWKDGSLMTLMTCSETLLYL